MKCSYLEVLPKIRRSFTGFGGMEDAPRLVGTDFKHCDLEAIDGRTMCAAHAEKYDNEVAFTAGCKLVMQLIFWSCRTPPRFVDVKHLRFWRTWR